MKNYELSYLASSEISEQEVKKIQEKISSLIQKEGGILIQEKIVEKRRLAYPVKKQIQAFLAVVNFQLLPEKITVIEKELKSDKEILRYLMLIKLPVRKVKALRSLKRVKTEKLEKEKKIDLEEIEKKLDEIL